MEGIVIAVDFDGTCVTHDFPAVGKDIGAIPVLKELIETGHELVLFTMRSGQELQDAIDWFEKNEISLYGVNENPTQKEWTSSPKAYAQLYIDDASVGCPLKKDFNISYRPFVDWVEIRQILIDKEIL